MRSYTPKAYEQGDLNRLCGLYAVVNAIRHAIGPFESFRGRQSRWLFQQLILALDLRGELGSAIVDGLSTRTVQFLLRVSQKALAEKYDYTFVYRCPFHRRKSVRLPDFVRTIAETCRPGCSVLARFCDHWSVIERTTSGAFCLLDSVHFKQVRHRGLLLTCASADTDLNREWVTPGTLHFLTYRGAGPVS